MNESSDVVIPQSAVIPFRVEDGSPSVLLITSRRRKRWGVPKGLIEEWQTPRDAALEEAYEEAGVRGDLVGESRWGEDGLGALARILAHGPTSDGIVQKRTPCAGQLLGILLAEDSRDAIDDDLRQSAAHRGDRGNPTGRRLEQRPAGPVASRHQEGEDVDGAKHFRVVVLPIPGEDHAILEAHPPRRRFGDLSPVGSTTHH